MKRGSKSIVQGSACALVRFIAGVVDGITAPTILMLQENVGSDMIWIIFIFHSIGMCIGSFVTGVVLDKIKNRWILRNDYGRIKRSIFSVSFVWFLLNASLILTMILHPIVKNIWVLAALRFFFGYALGGLYGSAYVAMDWIYKDNLNVPIQINSLMSGLGQLTSPLLVFFILLVVPLGYTLHVSYFLHALLLVITNLIVFFVPPVCYHFTPSSLLTGESPIDENNIPAETSVEEAVSADRIISFYSNLYWIFGGIQGALIDGKGYVFGELFVYYLVSMQLTSEKTGDLYMIFFYIGYTGGRFVGVFLNSVWNKPHFWAIVLIITNLLVSLLMLIGWSNSIIQLIASPLAGLGVSFLYPCTMAMVKPLFGFEMTGLGMGIVMLLSANSYFSPGIAQALMINQSPLYFVWIEFIFSVLIAFAFVLQIVCGKWLSKMMKRGIRRIRDKKKSDEKRIRLLKEEINTDIRL